MTIKVSEVLGGMVICLPGKEAGKSPYDWDCGVIVRPSGVELCSFDEFDEAQAAAHAINQHDKLVEENQRLREVLSEAVADTEPESPRHWHDEAKELLNRT